MTRKTAPVEWASTAFAALGLTGAVSASRYVGATAAAAPTTGTFAVGDHVITQTGRVLVCISAGTPGTWIDTSVPETHDFTMVGNLTVKTGTTRVYLEGNYTVESVRASVGTAPTGASVLVDVNKNGTTIYTTQSARPTITASGFTALGGTPAVTTFASGDYLTVDVDQIGSTLPGADLVVTVRLRRTP